MKTNIVLSTAIICLFFNLGCKKESNLPVTATTYDKKDIGKESIGQNPTKKGAKKGSMSTTADKKKVGPFTITSGSTGVVHLEYHTSTPYDGDDEYNLSEQGSPQISFVNTPVETKKLVIILESQLLTDPEHPEQESNRPVIVTWACSINPRESLEDGFSYNYAKAYDYSYKYKYPGLDLKEPIPFNFISKSILKNQMMACKCKLRYKKLTLEVFAMDKTFDDTRLNEHTNRKSFRENNAQSIIASHKLTDFVKINWFEDEKKLDAWSNGNE